jgi:hypothetical protein
MGQEPRPRVAKATMGQGERSFESKFSDRAHSLTIF